MDGTQESKAVSREVILDLSVELRHVLACSPSAFS